MKPVKIFLADDSELIREEIKKILITAENMIIVGEADNGVSALAGITESMPDAAILDLYMPGLTGFEVAFRLRAIDADIRIIIVSLFHDEKDIDRALNFDVDAVLLKETLPDELIECINSVMNGIYYLSINIKNHKMGSA